MVVKLKAPAKVNLFLEVKNKRKDGYHNILTFFLKIGVFDELFLSARESGIEVVCDHDQLSSGRDNLVYKAATLLQKYARVDCGARIKLIKNIPIGAGLGGGSSDAAATLCGLNKLWKLDLTLAKLVKIGRKIGADVPFFLYPEPAATATGRGDVIKPEPLNGKRFWILLVIPDIFVSTKQVYEALPQCLTNPRNDVKLLSYALKNYQLADISANLYNRLEVVTFKRFKTLPKIKRKLLDLGAKAVLMSGSGSVIFAMFDTREEAMFIRREILNCYNTMVVRSL